MSSLTDKQRIFVLEYLVDLNATQAAIRAGYSEDSARQIAAENMSKPDILEAIEEAVNNRVTRLEITADRVLAGILNLADLDIGEAYDKNGNLLPVHEMPKHVRKAITSVKSFEEFEGFGQDKIKTGDVREVRFTEKSKNWELLAKYLKLLTDKVQHSGDKENPIVVEKLSSEEIKALVAAARGNTQKDS